MNFLGPFFGSLLLLAQWAAAQSNTTPGYLDPTLPIDARVNDLASRLTLDEKISQMQDVAPAISRLQIPAYNWWNEGLHGVAYAGKVTVFPQAIGLAASWDTRLLHNVADVISTEARGKFNDAQLHHNTARFYGLTFWAPNINIFRDPRWGRGQETYGEDPFLTAQLGIAFVKGMQGDDARYLKTVATPKHYAVHSGPEAFRHRSDVPVTLHDFYDTYTPAFRATVVDGHAGSIMCAYNSVLGEPACASHLLLDLLRKDWGFNGYVVSDCGAVSDFSQGHGFVVSPAQAAALAVKAGTDLSCGAEYRLLSSAIDDRLLSSDDVDVAFKRLLEARFKLGMFDPPDKVPWSKLSRTDVDTAEHRKLALEAAHESIVLLKNEGGTLPLKSTIRSIAVVGPTADSYDALVGEYNGTPSAYQTILGGIRKRFPEARINYADGAPLTETRPLLVPASALRGGLTAEYFANTRLEGPPVLTRTETVVNSEWNIDSPGSGVPIDNYSVRWTGTLVPPVEGDYRIGAGSDGGYRFYFENKLLSDDWSNQAHNDRAMAVPVHLQAGHAYAIKLEYFHEAWESYVHLLWLPPNVLDEAVSAARKSDVVIAVVGITAQLEGEESENSDPGFFGGDRTDITLPAPQQQLLDALAATGRPLVVVLTNGSALAVNWAADHASAMLEAWYPGEEGGTAVADVLSGDYNPAGRLPITFYRSVAQLPPFTNYNMAGRTYRYLGEQPLFPFGFGLSYSTFSFSDFALAATPGSVPGDSPVNLSAHVKNTSSIAGDEVVELYISHPGVVGAPIRALVGFQRIHLAAGDTRQVSFTLTPRDLSIVDPTGHRLVPAGPVDLWLGGSQPTSRAGAVGAPLHFTILKSTSLTN
jgi:beta-glucosidase